MIGIDLRYFIPVSGLILIGLIWAIWRLGIKFQKLKNLAYSDNFGIFNHRELNKRINSLVNDPSISEFTFMLIDIDGFKNGNETCGYDETDMISQEFVNITKGFIRASDLFFRYKNSDEFVLIFNNTDIEEAKEIGNRLRRVVAYHPFKIDDQLVSLIISMGITSSFKKDSSSQIMKRAEMALHEAKQSKNTVVLLEESKVESEE